MRYLLIFLAFVMTRAELAHAKKRQVLVVVSSEDKITLKDGVTHPTGFFLSELMVPVKALLKAGYGVVVANPKGNPPVMDKVSDSPFWFGDVPGASASQKKAATKEYRDTRRLCERLKLCGRGSNIAQTGVKRLSDVVPSLDSFSAVFIPGGHAPMEDLWKNPDVGTVLHHFHSKKKPTALICHGPISLLSALEDPEGYIKRLQLPKEELSKFTANWIYRGYRMAVFTTAEEKQEEPGEDNALGGFVKFYPDVALEGAGAVIQRAEKWKGNVIRDRELITGQNPSSDKELAQMLLRALAEQKVGE